MKRILRVLHKERPYEVLVKLNVLFKMKLIVIILVVAAGLQVNANGFAQNTVTLSERNSPLTKVLKEIKRQTGYSYVLTGDQLAQSSKVNIEVTNVNLKDALDMIFREQPLLYTIVGKAIVVKDREEPKKEAAADGLPIDVRGRVVNEKGEPVEGVTVTVKGTKKFTITNANGEFSLATVDPEAVLVFSSVNMEGFEYAVSGRVDFVVNLKTKVSALGEVTVSFNTGFQQIPKERATGSFVNITKDQLDARVAPDILSKLEGITNALVFNKDPYTNENKLRIRGESTIFANPNPLIVIDNFPYDGDISNINPNDVESISILKDAAAASIWGVQAGNGVIVITTRKGKLNQRTKVELNTNLTIGDKPDLFYLSQMTSSDYIDFETFLFNKGYYNGALTDVNKKALSPMVEMLNSRKSGLISAKDSASLIASLTGNDLRNELLKHIYQKSLHQQYQLNISGGSNKASYYFSSGYDKISTDVMGNSSNRVTLSSQNRFKPIEKLELNVGLFYTDVSKLSNGSSNIPNAYPYTRLAGDNGVELSVPQHRVVFEDTIASHGFIDWKYYPLRERNYNDNKSRTADTRVLAELNYAILKGLNVEISYQYQRSLTDAKNLRSAESYYVRDKYNTFAILSNGNFIGSNYNSQQLNRGLLDLSSLNLRGHYGRAKISYNKTWKQHALNGIAGFEVREISTDINSSRLYGYDAETGSFVMPNLFTTYPVYPSGGTSVINDPGVGFTNGGTINRFRSTFANVAYTYKNRYTVSGSARFDGSNYFGVETNRKTVPLWSMGTKWDIHKESFYNLSLSLLSLSASYGYNGNLAQNIAAVTTLQYSSTTAAFTGVPFAYINNIPNPELRWEKTGQFNIALEFATKNYRIRGRVEYFRKNGKDLIGDAPIDPTTGIRQIRGNFSGMKSNGVDAELNLKLADTKLKWNSTFLFNYAAEKVTRYDVAASALAYLSAFATIRPSVGQPLYSLYSFRWGGLDPTTGGPTILLSDTVFKTYTSSALNKVNLENLVFSGRYYPPITGSLYNDLSWKGLTLGFNIQYKLNYYFRRAGISYSQLVLGGWQTAGSNEYSLRWQQPGDEIRTNVPAFIYPTNSTRDQLYQQSDVLVEKGDHVRLQFINLSYDLTPKLLHSIAIQQLKLYTYVNNIGIIWRANDKHLDPDFPYATYPPQRTYSIGLRVTFQ